VSANPPPADTPGFTPWTALRWIRWGFRGMVADT